ncbi:MAG: ATP synthase subunit C family protein [Azospirillum sp.]|nr:ATP synthase subunit C family protein [Azospirillum sp.]
MEPMAYIGAAMCALTMTVAAWGVTKVWTTIITTVGRNPQVKKDVDIYGWAGFAAVEAIALYALVIALVMLTGGSN